MSIPDTIIFDLGGVLIDWNPKYLYQKIFHNENDLHYFLENICTSSWNQEQDAGYPLAQATDELADKYPEYDAEIRAYYGRWQEMLGGYDEQCVAILKNLHQQQHCRLLALTNWSSETFHTAKTMYPFLNLFEGIVVSGDEKIKNFIKDLARTSICPINFVDDHNRMKMFKTDWQVSLYPYVVGKRMTLFRIRTLQKRLNAEEKTE